VDYISVLWRPQGDCSGSSLFESGPDFYCSHKVRYYSQVAI
jgi:hypothetical protein